MDNKVIIHTQLNKALFDKKVKCSSLIVPNNRIKDIQKKFHKHLMIHRAFKPCQQIDGDNTHKKLVFNQMSEE